MSPPIALFLRPAREVMGSLPPVCDPAMSCAELVARMAAGNADCALLCDAPGRPIGLVTESDVVRRIAFTLAPDAPARQAMSAPVLTAALDEALYRLHARMSRAGLERIVIVDGEGRATGMVTRALLLDLAAPRFLSRLGQVACIEDVEGPRMAKRAQAGLATMLLEDGLDGPSILSLIAEINDDIHSRVLQRALGAMRADGWGPPPLAHAFIVMGSLGRREALLHPDQDNGMILADYPDDRHGSVDSFFAELARRVNGDLELAGFPRCAGHVMAMYPLWRKSLGQWQRQIAGWVERRSGAALLQADIFFDFHPVQGDAALAGELGARALETVAGRPDFLRALAASEGRHDAGLGWFDRLVTEQADEAHRDEVNLKRNGLLPIAEGARLYALARQVPEVGTPARLQRLGELGILGPGDAEKLSAAFGFMAGLLLRQQAADLARGARPSHHVAPDSLAVEERERLVAAMKAAQELRRRARADFTGEII
ncbi:MAG: CBS domain-containing protein [Alphaproteobacteria bacterium]|nr:CBS domain-containing protein [Alphaproteobacteria bacterium]